MYSNGTSNYSCKSTSVIARVPQLQDRCQGYQKYIWILVWQLYGNILGATASLVHVQPDDIPAFLLWFILPCLFLKDLSSITNILCFVFKGQFFHSHSSFATDSRILWVIHHFGIRFIMNHLCYRVTSLVMITFALSKCRTRTWNWKTFAFARSRPPAPMSRHGSPGLKRMWGICQRVRVWWNMHTKCDVESK